MDNIINKYMDNIIFEIKEIKINFKNLLYNPHFITISNKIIRTPVRKQEINYISRFPPVHRRGLGLQYG